MQVGPYFVDENYIEESYDDFIGIYNGFFPREFCEDAIKFFDFSKSTTAFVKHRNTSSVTDDYLFSSTFEHTDDVILTRMNHDVTKFFMKIADFCVTKYFQKYQSLQGMDGYAIYDLKLQKTLPGQGFHAWHYENARRWVAHRKLVVQLYLNDVEEGGETEFLHYPKRIKPEMGKFLIWPAEFTHTHRGNTPLSGEKYIITTWVEQLTAESGPDGMDIPGGLRIGR